MESQYGRWVWTGRAHLTKEGDSSSSSMRKLKMATFCDGCRADRGREPSWATISAILLGRLRQPVARILNSSAAVPAVMSMSFTGQPEAVQS